MRTIHKSSAVFCMVCFVLFMLTCCSRNPNKGAQTTNPAPTSDTTPQGENDNEMSDENGSDVELDIDVESGDRDTAGKEETEPVETKPEETKPEKIEPVETKPVETKPEEEPPATEPAVKPSGNGGLELPMIPG